MLIDKSVDADEAEINPKSIVTLALVGDPSGVVVEFQQEDGDGGWFPMVIDGDIQQLDANNTVKSIYAPMKLNISKGAGTNCGVSLIQSKYSR